MKARLDVFRVPVGAVATLHFIRSIARFGQSENFPLTTERHELFDSTISNLSHKLSSKFQKNKESVSSAEKSLEHQFKKGISLCQNQIVMGRFFVKAPHTPNRQLLNHF